MIGISFTSVKSIRRHILSAKKPTEDCEMMTNNPPHHHSQDTAVMKNTKWVWGRGVDPTNYSSKSQISNWDLWLLLQDLDSCAHISTSWIRWSPTWGPGFQIPHLKPGLRSSHTCPKITWSGKALLPQFWCEKLGKRKF